MSSQLVSCQYCGEQVSARARRRHEELCLGNREVFRRVEQVLHGLAFKGFICSRREYEAERAWETEPLPSARFLVDHEGSWDAVAKRFSLSPLRELRKHRVRFALAFIQDLSKQLHKGRYAPSRAEYERRRNSQLPTSAYLVKRYGSWAQTVAEAGLEPAPLRYYRRALMRRNAQARERMERRRARIAAEQALLEQEQAAGLKGKPVSGGTYFHAASHQWRSR